MQGVVLSSLPPWKFDLASFASRGGEGEGKLLGVPFLGGGRTMRVSHEKEGEEERGTPKGDFAGKTAKKGENRGVSRPPPAPSAPPSFLPVLGKNRKTPSEAASFLPPPHCGGGDGDGEAGYPSPPALQCLPWLLGSGGGWEWVDEGKEGRGGGFLSGLSLSFPEARWRLLSALEIDRATAAGRGWEDGHWADGKNALKERHEGGSHHPLLGRISPPSLPPSLLDSSFSF